MNAKFTPGPWRLGESHGGGSTDIKEANHHKLVATAITPGDHAQARANARLIAKAPEMREKLQTFVDEAAGALLSGDAAGYVAIRDSLVSEVLNLLAEIDGAGGAK